MPKKNIEALASTSSDSTIQSPFTSDANIIKQEDYGKEFQGDTGVSSISIFSNYFSDQENVRKIAKLAGLLLTDYETVNFSRQLSDIISYVEMLQQVPTENTKITSQVTGLENVTREDKINPSLSQEEALSNAKSQHNGFVKVPAILE